MTSCFSAHRVNKEVTWCSDFFLGGLHGGHIFGAIQNLFFLHHLLFVLQKDLDWITHPGFHSEFSKPAIQSKDLSPKRQNKTKYSQTSYYKQLPVKDNFFGLSRIIMLFAVHPIIDISCQ